MRATNPQREARPLRVHLRHMIRRDLPEVMAIENASFAVPWLEEDITRALCHNAFILLVAETPDEWVAGYSIVERRKQQSREILKIATVAGARRFGVGRQLLAREIDKTHAPPKLTAVVNEANLPAQLFFAACGFRCERVLRKYYDAHEQDGYEFRYREAQPREHYPHRRLIDFGPANYGGYLK